MEKKKKKCITVWIEEDIINEYDKHFHLKSFFIRECIKQAIKDKNFYIKITMGAENGNKKEIL